MIQITIKILIQNCNFTSGVSKDLLKLAVGYRQQLSGLLEVSTDESSDGELAAMVSFAIAFPDGFMALVDTYDVKRYFLLCSQLHTTSFFQCFFAFYEIFISYCMYLCWLLLLVIISYVFNKQQNYCTEMCGFCVCVLQTAYVLIPVTSSNTNCKSNMLYDHSSPSTSSSRVRLTQSATQKQSD